MRHVVNRKRWSRRWSWTRNHAQRVDVGGVVRIVPRAERQSRGRTGGVGAVEIVDALSAAVGKYELVSAGGAGCSELGYGRGSELRAGGAARQNVNASRHASGTTARCFDHHHLGGCDVKGSAT